jgi:large subunit ribosomal protein L6
VVSSAGGRDGRRLQGLGRALLMSMVKGASAGYERILELVGTGYRCEVKGKTLVLQLGLSHPASIELPPTVSAVVPPDSKGTQLVLTSADKALLGQLAATIRALRPPEPYGGKGIRYRGESIRRKAGKAAKAKAK